MKELPLPSIASLRAIAALRSQYLASVRPARIGLGFESAGGNQKSLAEVEELLGGPGRLSLPYSLRWLLDVLTGLGVLHRTLGFVHGEVQPEHVVLGEDGVGRLVPVVRAHWARDERRAPERLYYLAPEKLLGDKLDVRSDVFSVGVMLWEALAGQRLLEATEVDDIIARLMGGGIPRAQPPENEAWSLPLAGIAEQALAVDPARRFATVAEMKEALESACSRYLASAPGMAELFQSPERRARSRARDSLPPESQRATLPPAHAEAPAPAAELATLDAAAERLARESATALDIEDETVTEPQAAPAPAAAPLKHVQTLLGVPAPVIQQRESSAPDSIPQPFVWNATPAPTASAVAEPRLAHNVTRPVGTPAPVITPRSATSEPRAASAAAPLGEAFGAEPRSEAFDDEPELAPQWNGAEPSFELTRTRKSRAALWLVLGAAAAAGAFAARPWLAERVAAATGALPDRAVPIPDTAPNPPPASLGPQATVSATTHAGAAPRAVGIASTPPAPERPGPHARPRAPYASAPEDVAPSEPEPVEPPVIEEPTPEPIAEPPEPPPPPPPPPPAPKPKQLPTSDADRYGI